MCKVITRWILITCLISHFFFSYSYEVLGFVEFENGKQSQVRELILKQKQEKEKLIREKYKKGQELKKKVIQKQNKQPYSFTNLKTFLITGLFLLVILGIALLVRGIGLKP